MFTWNAILCVFFIEIFKSYFVSKLCTRIMFKQVTHFFLLLFALFNTVSEKRFVVIKKGRLNPNIIMIIIMDYLTLKFWALVAVKKVILPFTTNACHTCSVFTKRKEQCGGGGGCVRACVNKTAGGRAVLFYYGARG